MTPKFFPKSSIRYYDCLTPQFLRWDQELGDLNLILPHYVTDCFFEAVEGEFEHGKDFLDMEDRPCVCPFHRGHRIDPDRVRKGFDNELESHKTGLS